MVRFSPYNTIFLAEERSISDDYLHAHVRKLKHSELSAMTYDIDEPFYQPITYQQYVCIQFDRENRGTAAWNYTEMEFYDEDGFLIETASATHQQSSVTVGNLSPNGEQYYTEMYMFKPSELDGAVVNNFLASKEFFSIKLKVHFGDGTALGVNDTVLTYTSDICHLATSHEDTSLIEYSQNVNKDYTTFEDEDVKPIFQLRVPSKRKVEEFTEVYDTYVEQDKTLEQLDTDLKGRYKFVVDNVSAALMRTIRFAMLCPNLRIDGDLYEKDPESPNSDSESRLMKFATFYLKDVDDELTYTTENTSFVLWEKPTSGDVTYAISSIFIWDYFGYLKVQARVFEAASDETTFVSSLNTSLSAVGINGTVSTSGLQFIFTNAQGENYRLVNEVEVFDKNFDMDIYSLGGTSKALKYYMGWGDFERHKHVYRTATGAGVAAEAEHTGNSALATVSVPFTSIGAGYIRIFHKDEHTYFAVETVTSNDVQVTDVSGEMSSSLERLSFFNQAFTSLTSLDLSFIAPAADRLEVLSIINSGLQGITAGWASLLASGSYKPFVRLKYVWLSKNSMDTTYLDAFYNEFDNSTNYQPGNYQIDTSNQSPTAAPSAASATARANIAAKQWTILT